MNVLGLKLGLVEKVVAAIVLFTLVAGLLPVSFAVADTELVDDTVLLVDGLPADSVDSDTAEVSEVIFDTDDTEVEVVLPDTEVERVYVVSGYKYECIYDAEAFEGEGGYNCDTPVEGWGISASNGEVGHIEYTNAEGFYSFTLPAGEWEVSEAESDYWQQYYTWQNGDAIESYTCDFDFRTEAEVMRAEGADADGYCDFGNVHITYPITGFKWNDTNANGMKDEGEAGVADWKITAYEGDGKATRQVETITDENGAYTLDLEQGEWTVVEEGRQGWRLVAVAQDGAVEPGVETCQFSIVYSDELSEDISESSEDCTFYNQYGPFYPVIGQKWNDANANGVRDEGESGIAGWTIYADNIDNDLAPVSVVTSENGSYVFYLAPGDWIISEELRSGWTQTRVEQDSEVSEAITCQFSLGRELFKSARVSLVLDNAEVNESAPNCTFYNHLTPQVEEPETPRRGGGGSGTRVKDRTAPTPQVLGASTTVPACGMYLTDYMRMGKEASSTEVTKLQVFLNAVGIKLEITGMFDAATDAAVRTFQMKHKAEVLTPWYLAKFVPHENPTGWVYQLTRWKINNIVCPGSEAYPVLN